MSGRIGNSLTPSWMAAEPVQSCLQGKSSESFKLGSPSKGWEASHCNAANNAAVLCGIPGPYHSLEGPIRSKSTSTETGVEFTHIKLTVLIAP